MKIKFSNNLFIFHNFVYKKDDNLFKQMKICIHERKGKFILRNGIRKTKFPKVVHQENFKGIKWPHLTSQKLFLKKVKIFYRN